MADKQASNNAVLKVGDQVRSKWSGKPVGVVIAIDTVHHITVESTDSPAIVVEEEEVEAVPANPTQEQAWQAVSMIAIAMIKNIDNKYPHYGFLYEPDRRAIRQECYACLGSAGVKVTDEVKQRVMDIVESVARAMDMRVI